MNAFETNLTADWRKKENDDIVEKQEVELKEENNNKEDNNNNNNSSEVEVTGGRVRERDGWGRGVFPLLAMLNHNCDSNARCSQFQFIRKKQI